MRALVFLSTGFEEIEATTIIDVLRRCSVDVTVAGLTNHLVEGAHGIRIAADKLLAEVDTADFDAVICPGGGIGTEKLRKNQKVLEIIRRAFESGKLVAAMCAAPAVLSDAGVLKNRRCTIYPGMENELEKGGGKLSEDIVVVDDNVITSRGPATALPFALRIAERLVGKQVAEDVGRRMLVPMILR